MPFSTPFEAYARVGASVGDSGAWWVTLAEAVELTSRQVRKPLVGSGEVSVVPFGCRVDGPGVAVVASDGLLAYARRAEVVQVLCRRRPLDETASATRGMPRPRAVHESIFAFSRVIRCRIICESPSSNGSCSRGWSGSPS